MRHVLFFVMSYFALPLQQAVRGEVAIGEIAPNLLMMVSIAAFFAFDGKARVFWAAVPALIADALSPESMGIRLLAVGTLLAFCAGFVRPREKTHWGRSALGALCGMFFLSVAGDAPELLAASGSDFAVAMLREAAGGSIFATVLMVPVVWIVRRVFRRLPNRLREPQPRRRRWGLLGN